MGFTAPSVEGQAGVIAEAPASAGVQAEDVGYVEAHGTGRGWGPDRGRGADVASRLGVAGKDFVR